MSKRVAYVSASKAGQVTVKDSPIYGKVDPPTTQRKGIVVLDVDSDGQVGSQRFIDLGMHVGWVATHPTNGCVYACGDGGVLALMTSMDGGVEPHGELVDAVGDPDHFEISADGGWLLSASYSAGTVSVLPIRGDGRLGAAVESRHHAPVPGSGLKLYEELADRQEASHPHQIRVDPRGGKWVLVSDLGLDCVYVYAFDAGTGSLRGAANSTRHLKLPKGSGPRHFDFHPSGRWIFVLCELDGMVVSCSWDSDDGRLVSVSSAQSMPAGVEPARAPHSGCAQILCSRDGKFVFVSTRTDNRIVSFAVDPSSGGLTRISDVSCQGVCPRNFNIEGESAPKRLRVCNQDTQTIASFEVKSDGNLVEPPTILPLEGVCPSNITLPCVLPEW
eukprot:TRINITY_DN10520_c0_g1_i1.p1 TRINITY_DN10520_c0_g1~~TRINITY_DN10520_c0_g1_i1.p1  ORF type:complete len:388 (-),score=54.68 TRINITY_DN10520_c0_g1_i1:200-1363(-)